MRIHGYVIGDREQLRQKRLMQSHNLTVLLKRRSQHP